MLVRVIAFFLLLLGAHAQLPRIASIGGIELSDLFTSPTDITNDLSLWGPASGPDLQKPQAHRTIYGCFTGPSVGGTLTFASPVTAGLNVNNVRIQLVSTPATSQTLEAKLEHPYLEVDPYGCAAAAGGLTGDCRCNPASAAYSVVADGGAFAQPVIFAVTSAGVTTPTNSSDYIIPSSTYFEHAPFPGQNPFMRTYQKLCIRPPQNIGIYFTDSNIWIAVTKCCVTDSDCVRAAVAFSWNSPAAPTTSTVNPWSAFSYSFNTLPDATLPAAWVCNKQGYLGAYFASIVASAPTAITISPSYDGGDCWGETQEMTLARQKRLTCCGAQPAATTAYPRDWLGITNTQQKYGTCIDTSIDQCCGWKPFNPRFEQCCSKYHSRISNIDQPCKCTSETENFDCKRFGANTLVATSTTTRGELEISSTTRFCCVNSKYPELTGTNALSFTMRVPRYGTCFDSTDPVLRCCDDGQIYDQGSQQCCVVNGVQSLNIPCPCSNDGQCNGWASTYKINTNQIEMNKVCCIQQWPRSWLDGQAPILGQCDKYANWPDGTGPAELQRCAGNCIDTRFQTCCNGRVCVKKYERCCNSTCCNRFTSGCMEGTRPGSRGFGSRVNPTDYLVSFETCSSIEIMTTRRAFWVWVMPTFWCIATAISLAIVIVVARRATENSFPLTERCMVFFSIFLIGLGAPHFFSPSYKYGVTIVFGAMFALVGAVMESRRFSLAVVLIMVGMVLYWIDPFNGNVYLALPGGLPPTNNLNDLRVTGNPISNPINNAPAYAIYNYIFGSTPGYKYSSGILELLFDLERNRADCTGFYDYFSFDPYVHDMERVFNPAKTTFGFCTRAWMTTLLIFSLVAMAVILVLLTLSIFSFAKKIVPRSYHEDTAYTLPLDTQIPAY